VWPGTITGSPAFKGRAADRRPPALSGSLHKDTDRSFACYHTVLTNPLHHIAWIFPLRTADGSSGIAQVSSQNVRAACSKARPTSRQEVSFAAFLRENCALPCCQSTLGQLQRRNSWWWI
jgi:hypothetical protein